MRMQRDYHRRVRHCLTCALLLSAFACGSMKSPAGVADRFMDKYYVESDQQGALPLADGVARLRLESELRLVGAARRGVAPGSLTARVYYKRKALSGQGDKRQAEYALQIKPQGGSDIQRDAHLELAQQPDGTWRVTRFSETSSQ
jgi:hypothetical protein